MPAFIQTDLSVGQSELNEIQEALANLGVPDAITRTCASRDRYVRDTTAKYTVPEETLKRLWQALVLFDLYTYLPGEMPVNRKLGYDEAMKELLAIRDGEYPQYALAAEQPSGFSQGAAKWGGASRIS
jgi:hypothetical protein